MKSESIKELTIALAKAQIAFLPIKRTEKVDYQTTGGRKKYNYAPLSEVIEATKKALSDNGLAITQSTYLTGGNTILETVLSHSSGEWRSSELYVGKQDQAPQAEGSALTYKRRYGISAILNVSSEEDDDATGAMGDKPKLLTEPESKAVTKSQPEKEQPQGHWCAEHQKVWFKRGKMQRFAHPLVDVNGQPILNEKGKPKWCNEPETEAPKDVEVKIIVEDVGMPEEENISEPEGKIDELAWETIRPTLSKLYTDKREGWAATDAIIKKLIDLGATPTGKIETTYNSLTDEGKQKFINLVEKEALKAP